jgi:hypothetical protein
MLPPRLALALAAGTLALLASRPSQAADVPQQMVFQGRLVRADGSPENSPRDLRFALYASPTGGAPLWEESHPAVPVTNGYYAVVLGSAQPLPSASFNGQPLHLGVSLVGQSELTPRLPIVSVPYALRAGDSARLEGRAASSFADTSHSHASVPYADQAGDSDKLGGVAATGYSRSGHGHAVATASSNGFMASEDKARLDVMPSTYGAGLTVTGSPATLQVDLGSSGSSNQAARADHSHPLATQSAAGLMAATDKTKLNGVPTTYGAGLASSAGNLSLSFPAAGGNNGSGSQPARADHSHAPALSCTWRTSQGSPAATAYCALGESLTGGSCVELDGSSNPIGLSAQPSAVTPVASAPAGDGGPGYTCRASADTNTASAYASCCRVSP